MINLGSALVSADPVRRQALFDEVIARVRNHPSGADPRLEMMLANALTGRAVTCWIRNARIPTANVRAA